MMTTEAGARALGGFCSAVSALSKATYWFQGFATDDGGTGSDSQLAGSQEIYSVLKPTA